MSGALRPAMAGAFMLPEGTGQFIAGVGYSEGSRRFDKTGNRVAAPTYRKREISGYLEYGLTSRISIIAAPTLAHDNGAPAVNSVTGSTSSAFGGRVLLYGTAERVVSLQALVQPPIGAGSLATQIANGGSRSLATDVRLMYGQSFLVLGYAAFIDLQPGVRLRTDPFPTEARFDATFGLRPISRLLCMLQVFNSFAHSSGPLIERRSYSKLQGSVVYDLTPVWSVQVGGFRTIAGRNAVQEVGPFGGVWYRF